MGVEAPGPPERHRNGAAGRSVERARGLVWSSLGTTLRMEQDVAVKVMMEGQAPDLGVAAAPRDRHLSRGRFRWRSRGPWSAKSRPSCSSKIRTIVGSVSFLPGIGRVLESEQVLTPLAQTGIRLWPGVGEGRCMFGVICETSVSVGRLVGWLGARPSQPAAAARAGWHGPLGDLCWSSPSSERLCVDRASKKNPRQ